VEDGLGAFTGQNDDEGGVGVGPDGDQEGDEASAVGEVDVDVTEVSLEPMAGWVGQRDEGGAGVLTVDGDVTADRGVGARVSVLVLEPAEHLGGGVPLLGRCVAIVAEDLVDDRGEWPEHGGRGRLGASASKWMLRRFPARKPPVFTATRRI
jgi:hypothetical protein